MRRIVLLTCVSIAMLAMIAWFTFRRARNVVVHDTPESSADEVFLSQTGWSMRSPSTWRSRWRDVRACPLMIISIA